MGNILLGEYSPITNIGGECMKSILNLLCAIVFFSSLSFAIDDFDSSEHLPIGTELIAKTDMLVLANSTLFIIRREGDYSNECFFWLRSSPDERIIRTGFTLQISAVKKSGYPHSKETLSLLTSNSQILSIDCSTTGSDTNIPRFGLLKEILSKHFDLKLPSTKDLPELY